MHAGSFTGTKSKTLEFQFSTLAILHFPSFDLHLQVAVTSVMVTLPDDPLPDPLPVHSFALRMLCPPPLKLRRSLPHGDGVSPHPA